MSPFDEALMAAEPVGQFGYESEEIRTGERTGAARLKWVVIVDRSLSPGQAVNAAICVAAATALAVPGLLGPGARDASGTWHYGLPWAGCSVLGAEDPNWWGSVNEQSLKASKWPTCRRQPR